MEKHGPFAEGAVEPRGRAVRHFEAREFAEISGVVFRGVGPHVDNEMAVGFAQSVPPMAKPKGF